MSRKLISLFAAIAMVASIGIGSALANIPGSTFEGGDGNLVVNTAGNTDWTNVTNKTVQADLATGTADNSFGEGSKENDVNIHVGTGSIPNSKADLGRFASAFQFTGGNLYLQLAWTRNNLSGTVNFDFEINRAAQPDLTTVGDKVLNRTPGDLLITYDFDGGAQKPTLGIRTWLAVGIWGPNQPLSATVAEAEVNRGGPVSDGPIGGSINVPAFAFGEANINLTAAGVVPSGACEAFSSIYVKSRSSTAFSATMKDFIAPTPVNINNCGTVTVIKHTNPGGLDQDFSFTSNVTGTGASSPFTLNDAGTDTKTVTAVPIGSYTITEGADPLGFSFGSVDCDVTGSATESTAGKVATVAIVAGGDTVTCTYVNDQNVGAIKVTKTAKVPGQGDQPQSGVDFTVNGVTKATGADGTACFDGLVFGSYDVTETVPAGYAPAGPVTKSVLVDTNTSCAADPYDGETVAFENIPLTNLFISVDSQADGGTASTVHCTDAGGVVIDFATAADGDGQGAANNLQPTIITCTIVIDP